MNIECRFSNYEVYPKKYDLEERLVNFAVSIIALVESMPNTKAANHLAGQLLRSGTSPALNYAEAQSGESRNDFIHKIKIVLKELRESLVCLKIIHKAKLYESEEEIKALIKETNELVSIFVKSARTAESKKRTSQNGGAKNCFIRLTLRNSTFGLQIQIPNAEVRITNYQLRSLKHQERIANRSFIKGLNSCCGF